MPRKRDSLFRYRGSKARIAPDILQRFPTNSASLHYVEPYMGSATVAFRTIREIPFKSFALSDKFEWVVRAWRAVRGDLKDWGDIIDRCIETRELLLPESENEPAIREYFDQCRERCRDGDYWAYMFMCQYAYDQYVYPQRNDVASFHAKFLGMKKGLTRLTPELMRIWRSILKRATVKKRDALQVLEGLDQRHFAYLDPPYMHAGCRRYAEEFSGLEPHERLRDILYSAKFKWAMSMGNHKLIRDWYMGRFRFERIRYKQRTTRSKHPRSWEWLILNY